jgi:arylsulfatase A-like enzyme
MKKLRIANLLLCCVTLCLLHAFTLSPSRAQNRSEQRPNIVLILADDLGYETLGSYGGTSYRTPHLDRLAATGMRFAHAYATPLCTPTRIQLMTGHYAYRTWLGFGLLNPQERTFGHYLKDAGYKTLMAGKWQFTSYDPPDYPGAEQRRNIGMRIEQAGFDEYSVWHAGHTEDKGSRYADPVIFENGKFRTDTKGRYGEDIWTDSIGDFMTRHRQQPFFVYYAMALPHNPFVPTPDSPEWQDPAARHKEQTRFFKDMVEYTDKAVGKVVAKLDELGLRENTLILFFSDNGTNVRVVSRMGEKIVRGGKGTMTDAGTRVPMIANWKGKIAAGKVSDELIDSTDFVPTLAEIVNYKLPAKAMIDGRSFAPRLRGQRGNRREWIYLHHDPRPGWDKDRFTLERCARNQRFKLYDDGRLFEVAADALEERPILPDADTTEMAAVRLKLQSVLDAHKPFPQFAPEDVPRENPALTALRDYAFQDVGGYVVIEAETPPLPRDESWRAERLIPGFLGQGYLRSLRDLAQPSSQGIVTYPVRLNTTGRWHLQLRVRSDHPSAGREHEVLLQIDDGAWLTVRNNAQPGQWNWVGMAVAQDKTVTLALALSEGKHQIKIAPLARGCKLDRLVLYQADRQAIATNPVTPQSEYHPW